MDREVAVLVEDVVDDLEQEPELVAELSPGRLVGFGNLRRPERAADRGGEQPPGLQPVQRREVVHLAVDVRCWPPIIPSVASASSRRLRRSGRRRQPERLREQRVAGEDGVRLAETRPHAGPAAPDVVVVERRQVVVDERERVDELERCGRGQHVLDVGARCLAVARQITGRTRLPPASNA